MSKEYRNPFEEDTYETEKEIPEENSSEKREPKAAKQNNPKKKKAAQGKKQSLMDSIKGAFSKEPKEEIPEMWTGQTSVLDVIAPSSVDNGSRDYIVVDGIYHSYLYVAGYGYRTRNEAA